MTTLLLLLQTTRSVYVVCVCVCVCVCMCATQCVVHLLVCAVHVLGLRGRYLELKKIGFLRNVLVRKETLERKGPVEYMLLLNKYSTPGSV